MEMATMSAASGIQITNFTVAQGCVPRNLTPWQTSSLLDLRRKPTIWSACDTSILGRIPMIRIHFEIVSDQSLAVSVD